MDKMDTNRKQEWTRTSIWVFTQSALQGIIYFMYSYLWDISTILKMRTWSLKPSQKKIQWLTQSTHYSKRRGWLWNSVCLKKELRNFLSHIWIQQSAGLPWCTTSIRSVATTVMLRNRCSFGDGDAILTLITVE